MKGGERIIYKEIGWKEFFFGLWECLAILVYFGVSSCILSEIGIPGIIAVPLTCYLFWKFLIWRSRKWEEKNKP